MWKPAIMHRQKGHSGGFLCTSHRLIAQEQHIIWLHPLMATCINEHCRLQRAGPVLLADHDGLTAASQSKQATWNCIGMEAVWHCITRQAA